MTTALKVLDQITAAAEKIKSDDVQQFPEAASIGDYWRQGDLYITRIADDVERGNQTKERQLAPGTTRGSRHVLKGGRVFDCVGDALTGPVVVVAKSGATITHPEHGNVELPKGTYGITYQRAFAEDLRRVAD